MPQGKGGGREAAEAAVHPLLPLLHISRSLKPPGQHETTPATLPKVCKPLPSYPPCVLCIEAQALTLHDPGDHAEPMACQKASECPSPHGAAAQAAAVYWEGKENGSQLLTPGMNRINLRRNRFIFRMVSQESIEQIARNFGY